MHFGKSKLPWIIMAGIMILMFTQGFNDINLMFVMMAVMVVILMMFWMKRETPNP
jgi:hypothetical protein